MNSRAHQCLAPVSRAAVASAACLAIGGCSFDTGIHQPRGDAKITLEIVFPESTVSPSVSGGSSRSSSVDRVIVTVRNEATQAVVTSQTLPIQGAFAEGDIDVPVVGTQTFLIDVFASDTQSNMTFAGFTFQSLQEGEVRTQPIEILVAEIRDITAIGNATASSTFNQDARFDPSRGIDQQFQTSWFSNGDSDGTSSTFTWSAPREVLIFAVEVFDNSFHSTPEFRTGFGFARITIQVFSGTNGTGVMRLERTVDYPSGPDDPAAVGLGVPGRSVRLILQDHQDPSCGGFSELQVVGADP